jgi:hypothetical protein
LVLSTSAQAALKVTSSTVTVSNHQYTVYDYADPATKKFCVVIPERLKTVRGLLVQCNYAGGDSRQDWTFCTYYREFMHLHGFALVASAGDPPHVKAFRGFRDCLQMVSVVAKHPELVNAPYAAVGFSAGGQLHRLSRTQPAPVRCRGGCRAGHPVDPHFRRKGEYQHAGWGQ